MDTGIGATLREARNRRKLDLAAVEAAIKIRVRYLQAMENEEWDALPGGAYTRGFIRTYASYLGLDGERLADDYRRASGVPGGVRVPKRVEPVPTARRGRRPLVSSRLVIAAVCLVLVAVVIGIALAGGGGPSPTSTAANGGKAVREKPAQAPAAPSKPGVAVRLAATAEVWVCLLDAKQEPLLDGQILEAGAEAGPFRSKGFEVALGNGSVAIFVDGKQAHVPASSSPVGYRVNSGGKLVSLEEGERPSCE
jgi:Helix-turn-helix domain